MPERMVLVSGRQSGKVQRLLARAWEEGHAAGLKDAQGAAEVALWEDAPNPYGDAR